MKLGDAGEAFFVELKDDESMVAPYLCTSPLPAEDAQKLMERGLEEMRSQCDANQVLILHGLSLHNTQGKSIYVHNQFRTLAQLLGLATSYFHRFPCSRGREG